MVANDTGQGGIGAADGPRPEPSPLYDYIRNLEAELAVARGRLQVTIEELESANQELKASNEEYLLINEELQSANGELETSQTELRALNEELKTVNGELAQRIGELRRANSDLKNLMESTQIATIFLDNALTLRSFTPATWQVFHLIDSDIGRPIAHFTAQVQYPELLDDARHVLKSLAQVEREVAGRQDDRRFLVRVLPYRSIDNVVAGVVVTFMDISTAARAEAALRSSERRLSEAQRLAGVGVWEWNLDTDERWWSAGAYQLWGVPPSGPQDRPLPIHPDDGRQVAADHERARRTGELDHEWRVLRPDGSMRWLAAKGRIESSPGSRRMLGVIQDITERKQTETRLKMLLGELQHRVRNILSVVRSIVDRTVRSSSGLEELSAHLTGRLDALARTQGVFARTGDAAVELEELIREELVAVAARDDQMSLRGPALRLRRQAAETLALAIHELCTNAVKYGALSEPAGRLDVSWRVFDGDGGRRLSLEWCESGVRALDVRPSHRGFGRELIERGLPYELDASTTLEFAMGGVRALIELPLSDKIAELGAPASAPPESGAHEALQ
jgi:two-component system CheB/CheR fusion protein